MTLQFLLDNYKVEFLETLVRANSLVPGLSYTDEQYNQIYDLIYETTSIYHPLSFYSNDENVIFNNVNSKFYIYGLKLFNVLDSYKLISNPEELNGLDIIKMIRPNTQTNNLAYDRVRETRKATAQKEVDVLVNSCNEVLELFTKSLKQFICTVY
jgi:hypothetical protein